jgi:N-acyl-D-aspartate/D-glutamate deacylase
MPGTVSGADELRIIAEAVAEGGPHGRFQYVSDDLGQGGDETWLAGVLDAGVPVTYTLAQSPFAPEAYRRALDAASASTAAGRPVTPQVPARPTGMLFGLQSSFHPFKAHPSFRPLHQSPLAEIVATLRDPQFRARLLAEEPQTHDVVASALATNWAQMYRLGADPDYEPPAEASAAAVAERDGRRPDEVVLDWLLEDDGEAKVFAPLGSYVANDHEAIREMLLHPSSVVGASDGGAHCALICDASFPSYLLTHWARDRTRGPRIAIEDVVRKQTSATAATYGLTDRGVIAAGKLADVNVIDHDAMVLHAPRMVTDLPAGGKRLLQDVEGYRFTIKSGEVTFADGEPTGARPGRVLRAS